MLSGTNIFFSLRICLISVFDFLHGVIITSLSNEEFGKKTEVSLMECNIQ